MDQEVALVEPEVEEEVAAADGLAAGVAAVEVDLGFGLEVAAEVVALTRMHLALTCYHLSVHNYARFYESVK
ncbi:hypothetical protein Gohar_011695 [Gossypium harknessii]|uniref:Uncharacterized protein n=1 Tax=Gossypium harknessii TaxID=34285 RepID=A0A7J9GUR8_9ROSI|nr:hypothetical protein [Gossypium harknessii]